MKYVFSEILCSTVKRNHGNFLKKFGFFKKKFGSYSVFVKAKFNQRTCLETVSEY